MNKNIIAFVVVRLSSSRLPNKQLKKIGEKRIIDWIIDNLKKSRYINKIVIATTDEKDNLPLVDIAKEHGIEIFLYKGDINDVVGRLARTAEYYNADIPILISGDCPLIWAESLDKLIEKALKTDADSVSFCKKGKKQAIHEGMGVFSKKCWLLADKLSDKPNMREHQFPIIGIKPELFKKECVLDDDIFYLLKHRVSVDTLADLEFMRAVYEQLKKQGKEFNMPNFIRLIEKNPELLNINKDVHQMTIDEKQKKALFIVKGYGNIELFYDMAYELTKKGVGVRFFAKENKLKERIKEKGFGIAEDKDADRFDFVIEER